jgi:hypothetical protein
MPKGPIQDPTFLPVTNTTTTNPVVVLWKRWRAGRRERKEKRHRELLKGAMLA